MSRVLAQVDKLSVRYVTNTGHLVSALDNVSLSVWDGEVRAIVGESGSGKSTLAASLLKLLPPTAQCSGSIVFEGRDLLSMPRRSMRHLSGALISLIPQDPASALNPVLQVGTQISEVLRAHLRMSRSQRRERVRELLSEVGFDNPGRVASSYPHQLSGGQRQRVVIAQAIACRPGLIIADESTSKLDGPLQLEIISLLTEIVRRHGTALIWITHELATAAIFSNRLAVMVAGQLVEEGLTQEILRRPAHPYTQELVRLSREPELTSRCAAGQ
jgi:ABC-type dipeptide/oligopeptide/nickel transport system ATPase component